MSKEMHNIKIAPCLVAWWERNQVGLLGVEKSRIQKFRINLPINNDLVQVMEMVVRLRLRP